MRKMKRFGKIVAVLIVAALLITLCSCDSNSNSNQKTMNYDDARKALTDVIEHARLKPTTLPVRLDPNEMFDLDLSNEAQSLPDISDYPFVVNPTTANFITVYSTLPEITQAANDFNDAAVIVDGKQVSVGVRAVDSALGTNFILPSSSHPLGKYTPSILIPASELYGGILSYRDIQCNLIANATVRDLSGIVTTNKASVKTFSDLVQRIHNGELTIGYVDPLQDTDSLNFILAVLHEFDSTQPIGEVAVEGLKKLQDNVSYIAHESPQLKRSFLRGILDGYVLNYSTYKNTSEYNSDHTFIPFGVPQSNPVYTIGDLTSTEQLTAQKFVEFCKKAATASASDSFVVSYKSNIEVTSGIAGELRSVYRSIKGGSSNTTAVFIADTSGSMKGKPLLRLKTGLRGAINAINPNNNIGLITFDSFVNIALPIAPFDGKQQSYFSNAISNMTDGSTTAMYDAIAVGLKMLLEYQDENPDTKLVLFVLTDGDSNEGIDFNRIRPAIAGLRIPIYTIGYESETNNLHKGTLEELATINEASYIDAESDDIVYILTSLLSSQS